VIIGDLYSEEEKDILVNISIAPSGPTKPTQDPPPILTVTASYLDVSSASNQASSVVVRLPRTAASKITPPSDPEVVLQRNRIITADAMRVALEVRLM
jgi:hypothetical protein